ncbi:hypothetical protein E2C01_082229 [Portunus trituberculatus]|uniref:Uncharacterized protein n=1 Tax=Portunus trituberculatus TaxID=210409 RepID=A0A5B7J376_PORTR|nr:hypothetical protein [Portunus trituberculatus]
MALTSSLHSPLMTPCSPHDPQTKSEKKFRTFFRDIFSRTFSPSLFRSFSSLPPSLSPPTYPSHPSTLSLSLLRPSPFSDDGP